MAIKFSQFNESTSRANVDFLVGYDGTDNVKISPSNFLTGYLLTTGGAITGTLTLSSTNSNIFFGNNKGMQWSSYNIDNPAIYGSDSFDGIYVGSMSGVTGFGPVISVHTFDSQVGINTGSDSLSYDLELANDSAGKPSTSAWDIVSDSRVKTNIRPYATGLTELLQIEPKIFDYNGKAGFKDTLVDNIGIIAQDVLSIIPETISTHEKKLEPTDENPTELYKFNPHALTFALINAVKELSSKIDSLETRIQTLENS
jgi:hypothetical protein